VLLRIRRLRMGGRLTLPWDYFLLARNPRRIDAKCGDHFQQADLSGQISRSVHCQSAPRHAMKQFVHLRWIRLHSFVDPPV
jgi:hypothetical protein